VNGRLEQTCSLLTRKMKCEGATRCRHARFSQLGGSRQPANRGRELNSRQLANRDAGGRSDRVACFRMRIPALGPRAYSTGEGTERGSGLALSPVTTASDRPTTPSFFSSFIHLCTIPTTPSQPQRLSPLRPLDLQPTRRTIVSTSALDPLHPACLLPGPGPVWPHECLPNPTPTSASTVRGTSRPFLQATTAELPFCMRRRGRSLVMSLSPFALNARGRRR